MDRSKAKKDYKQTRQPMGVFRIRNTRNGNSYVGSSTNLRAGINRQKSELKFGSHRNAALLREWKSFGESAFEFEVLDELPFDENSSANPEEELRILAEMWIRKLEDGGGIVVVL